MTILPYNACISLVGAILKQGDSPIKLVRRGKRVCEAKLWFNILYFFYAKQGVENIRVNVIGRVVHVTHFAELTSPTTLMTTLNKRHLGVSIVDTGSEADMETGIVKHTR